jgi:hypothetical protein
MTQEDMLELSRLLRVAYVAAHEEGLAQDASDLDVACQVIQQWIKDCQ